MSRYADFLDSRCFIDGFENQTWRDWCGDVLITLVRKGEGFSGKRPNCNSGWADDLGKGLVKFFPEVVEKSWEEIDTWTSDTSKIYIEYQFNWSKVNKVWAQIIKEGFLTHAENSN